MSDSSSLSNFDLSSAFTQFSLESQRIELAYHALQEKFYSIHAAIQHTNTRLNSKLAELDFTTRYLDIILNHMSQGLIFIDSNGGIITLYNAAAAKLTQIPSEKCLFQSVNSFFDDHFFGFSMQDALHRQTVPHLSMTTWKHNQQFIELEVETIMVAMKSHVSQMQFSHASSPIQGLLILIRDVTTMRRLQERLNHDQRLKELGGLAAHLAHEIRNPLGGIKGFASLLKHELSSQPDLQQMAESIVKGTDQLNAFVNQILNYTRPFQLHLECCDLKILVQEVVEQLQSLQEWNSSIQMSTTFAQEAIILEIDTHLFKSALLNILINACQAMPKGGSISVKTEHLLDCALIKIADTGCGIEKTHLNKIFSPFFTTKSLGNGLGLSEVQKVIQAHHGWIEVESALDRGSCFTIKIPFKGSEVFL